MVVATTAVKSMSLVTSLVRVWYTNMQIVECVSDFFLSEIAIPLKMEFGQPCSLD